MPMVNLKFNAKETSIDLSFLCKASREGLVCLPISHYQGVIWLLILLLLLSLLLLLLLSLLLLLLLSLLLLLLLFSPVVGAARILPSYSLRIVKGDKKGRSEGSGKPLLCILSYEKIGI